MGRRIEQDDRPTRMQGGGGGGVSPPFQTYQAKVIPSEGHPYDEKPDGTGVM